MISLDLQVSLDICRNYNKCCQQATEIYLLGSALEKGKCLKFSDMQETSMPTISLKIERFTCIMRASDVAMAPIVSQKSEKEALENGCLPQVDIEYFHQKLQIFDKDTQVGLKIFRLHRPWDYSIQYQMLLLHPNLHQASYPIAGKTLKQSCRFR